MDFSDVIGLALGAGSIALELKPELADKQIKLPNIQGALKYLPKFNFGSLTPQALPGSFAGGMGGPMSASMTPGLLGQLGSFANAAAPWALGGLTGLAMLNHLSTSNLTKMTDHFDQWYSNGLAGTGGPHPNQYLTEYFGIPSLASIAYRTAQGEDMGVQFDDNNKPWINGLDVRRYQHKAVKDAAAKAVEQGLHPSVVGSQVSYTPKQKAAAKLISPSQNSQVNMSNPWVLTDADRGR